jgi:hypothetical protein
MTWRGDFSWTITRATDIPPHNSMVWNAVRRRQIPSVTSLIINYDIRNFQLSHTTAQNSHRWFSGKISRCHCISWRSMSASPGFDSRPMHHAFFLLSGCSRLLLRWWWCRVGNFGAVKARTICHARAQPRAPPHLPRDLRVPPFLFGTYAPALRRCLPVIITSQSLFGPAVLTLSALSGLRRAVNHRS